MFDYFVRWKNETGCPHKLVLLGTEVMPSIPLHDDIIHLGFVGEQDKWGRPCARATGFSMPSPHESLSMALLETWSAGRPFLVNGTCDALTSHCRQTNLAPPCITTFRNGARPWRLSTRGTKRTLGRSGQAYVQRTLLLRRSSGITWHFSMLKITLPVQFQDINEPSSD